MVHAERGVRSVDPRVNQPDRSMIYKKGRKEGGGEGGGSCDTGMARSEREFGFCPCSSLINK